MPGISSTELARIDQALKTQLDILRHSATVEAEVLRILEQMQKELIAKLAQGDITEWGRARLNQMLKEASATIAEYYAKAQDILSPTYATVAGISAAQTATALAVTAPSRAVLESLVTNMLVEGSPMKAWWAKQSADTAFKFASAVRQGIAQSETLNQIFKRVNEATDLANRNSIALVHTSVMQVFNDAKLNVIQANADIAPTTRWLATLDSHTCIRCAPRDGLEWDTKTLKPIGHNLPFDNIPLHVGCRCTTIAVTPMLESILERGGGGRASTFGVQKGSTTFEEFLSRQSEAFQDDVLGKGRAELFRSGKITLRDLVSGKGAPLTLKQLERKYE